MEQDTGYWILDTCSWILDAGLKKEGRSCIELFKLPSAPCSLPFAIMNPASRILYLLHRFPATFISTRRFLSRFSGLSLGATGLCRIARAIFY